MKDFANRIVYYESSRGCPFRCGYCLSSIDKRVRLRDLALVKEELQFFLDQKVPQVKFIDRTFNCNHQHAMEIWKYIQEHDNGITNFHFEISADLLNGEELALLAKMRPGLVQLEIGVQSTNLQTLEAVRRHTNLDKLRHAVVRIHSEYNIHVHLDLIAGLPYEDMGSFIRSFNDVYSMRPQQLQLGFLKVLKGSYLEEMAQTYGIVYQNCPPYEVLYTKWLSYGDIIRLKRVEEMVELYYNSNQFTHLIPVLQSRFENPFAMYDKLADFYHKKDILSIRLPELIATRCFWSLHSRKTRMGWSYTGSWRCMICICGKMRRAARHLHWTKNSIMIRSSSFIRKKRKTAHICRGMRNIMPDSCSA